MGKCEHGIEVDESDNAVKQLCLKCLVKKNSGTDPYQNGELKPNWIDLWRFRVSWWEEWREFFRYKETNWIDMNLLRIHIERAAYKQSAEINISLVGFNLCFEYYWGIDNEGE